ncbi:DNA polymerase IV [Eubacteriales bacterium OttesenSCG-928-M02]|nr:DNA polymerase IV [Eubacteriales bacterium OttesenSCG-928-M02]
MEKTIIHVDMDAFYAAVEMRDNPALRDKPLIIGALPNERGVVSTCSYEARVYGVRSGMSIKEAYRRCPQGTYMHPDMAKYKAASNAVHEIWNAYTDMVEYISLDEGYLDVSASIRAFGSAVHIGKEIKSRTLLETGLTCSVGIGYSLFTAKLASEEKKPDGLFQIPDPDFLMALIQDRSVRTIYSVGAKTAEKLEGMGIYTVKDIWGNKDRVADALGKHGRQIVELASGVDDREVTPYYESEAKSIGRERTFQEDSTDFTYLKSVLRLLAKDLSLKVRKKGIYSQTITLKITYGNMQSITRSRSGDATNNANDIYRIAAELLDTVEKRPIRLVGISLSGLTEENLQQLSLMDMGGVAEKDRRQALDTRLLNLQEKYGGDIIKTGSELEAERWLQEAKQEREAEKKAKERE